MKNIILYTYFIFLCLFSLSAKEDKGMIFYQDSILNIINRLPSDSARLSYLNDMAYQHQYAPLDLFFATQLYNESIRQDDQTYENLGAYYLASCYDKKHDPDSLSIWVNKLKDIAPLIGNYDYYLEQKAAISRALASKRLIEKAVFIAKETLNEAKEKHSLNGELAAYNSLSCAYSVSSRSNEAIEVLLKARRKFTPTAKASLKVDILSRIAGVYGNNSQDSLKMPYLEEMAELLEEVIAKEPEAKNNWTNMAIDCEVKYITHFLHIYDYEQIKAHIEKAKSLLAPHVDPVFWLNVQLVQLQYYSKINEYDKSIALIDEVTPIVLNNYVSTFGILINYKSETQQRKGDIDGAISTRKYLIRTQDSLNNAFSTSQLEQIKEIYHIDELLLEKQRINNMNLKNIFFILSFLLILTFLFYLYTHHLSKKIAQSERAATNATIRSEANNQAKEKLRLEISHNVRTSLNDVIGFAELLTEADKNLNQESKYTYSKVINESAGQLLEYVNSILELSRLESGKIEYKQESCDLMQLCREEINIAHQTEGNQINPSLQTTIQDIQIQTDPTRFSLLLQSLFISTDKRDNNIYNTIIQIEEDKINNKLLFRIINTPLAKSFSQNKTISIRNEINAHFIRYFGGNYEIDNSEGTDIIIFTLPYDRFK